MSEEPQTKTEFTYPNLPIAQRREEIIAALKKNQVLIVVGETGSGKTTQLPKMALEVAGKRRGKVGCTQPRRLAAVSVARRIAEEVGCELGSYVGYQVRFDDRSNRDTKLKLMTDGILLAETQVDAQLRQYHTIILDEAHERSLNIDFLLGYMKILLTKRPDLKLIISSATMDAAAFSDFFENAPIIHAEGRTFPVEMHYMPARNEDEELSEHVCRAVEWLSAYDEKGDVLVFLPGEREIRECADDLERLGLRSTHILPLYARLGLAEQQRIFQPSRTHRRIVLATNVAETSLTIPGIIYVIDSGQARISRYLPGRQIQRLQIESISKASARQRAGRCGRICEGVCIRLYSEEDFDSRDDFTDPEIKRSSLAGVILRMSDLKLPPLGEFPLPDPPSARLINEGYHCLREVGALTSKNKHQLTPIGKQLARLPLDPRLGRMLIAAQEQKALPELLVIVAALSIMDPRERPHDKAALADQAQAQWRNEESDYLSLLSLWRSATEFQEGRRGWKRNQLRRWCQKHYINYLRIIEWHNLVHDLATTLAQSLRWRIPALPSEAEQAIPAMIHRSVLAGAPLQIGFYRPEEKNYRATGGREFAIFPGSGLFKRKKRPEWLMGSELVETTRLWMRRSAVLDPVWVEQVAPQLCKYHAYDPHWDESSGQVYAKERVNCGGLTIIDGRRISYARVNPAAARDIFIREAIMEGKLKDKQAPFLRHLQKRREEVRDIEAKLRRRDLLWCNEGVYSFFDRVLPRDIASEKALRRWRDKAEKSDSKLLFVPYSDCVYPGEDNAPEEFYPNEVFIAGDEKNGYPVYYCHDPGAPDDGITLGVHVDQLASFPDWLLGWNIPAHLAHRAESLLRLLPKDLRMHVHPLAQAAESFAEQWYDRAPDRPIEQALAEFVYKRTNGEKLCHARQFEGAPNFAQKLLPEYVTKMWVCDDDGKELAMGIDPEALREKLSSYNEKRFVKQAAKEQKRHFSDSPMTRWDCGELPLSIPIANATGYPALTEESERAVKVQVFNSEAEAAVAHRAGVIRLALLRHGDFVNHFRKSQKLPITDMEQRMSLSTLGVAPKGNITELVHCAMEGAMHLGTHPLPLGGVKLPRNAEEFDRSCLMLRERLYDIIKGPMARLWARFVEVDKAIRLYCLTAGHDRYGAQIAEELQRQWQWLTRPHYLTSAGYARVTDLDRYLRGILERLKRIKEQPAVRELERIKQLDEAIGYYYSLPECMAACDAGKSKILPPSLLHYGYMIEEYRLSLVAPNLVIKGRASAKKLSDQRPF